MSLSKLSISLTSQRNGIQAAYKLYHSKRTDVLYLIRELLVFLGGFWLAYIHCLGTKTVSSGQIRDRMRPVEMRAILLGKRCIKCSISTVCIVLLACENRGTKHSSITSCWLTHGAFLDCFHMLLSALSVFGMYNISVLPPFLTCIPTSAIAWQK